MTPDLRPEITDLPASNWLSAREMDRVPALPGAYLLMLFLDRPFTVCLPDTKKQMPVGWYVYAGSANGSGGIRARLRRHFQQTKKIHWHIDQLTTQATEITALAVPGGNECELIARIQAQGSFDFPLPGFGSSDCHSCISHLLRAVVKRSNS